MAITNYERQKKWREKNRAIYNLRRRNKRKKILSGVGESRPERQTDVKSPNRSFTADREIHLARKRGSGSSAPPAQLSKIAQLRELIVKASEEPTVPVVTPSIYRDDYGRVITGGQWEKLQKMKMAASDAGYVIDEFSQ